MPRRSVQEFRKERAAGQARLMEADHHGLKRFLRLDSAAYEDGALPTATKHLLGLVASMVLRCDDCVDYHLEQCVKARCGKDEIIDAMNVALIVGGSIVIPHLRRAMFTLDELLTEPSDHRRGGGHGPQ